MSNPAAIFKNRVDISNNSNLIIHSGGNLGIGVTNPSTHFDVDGSGNFSGNLDVNGTINTQNFIVDEDSNFGSSSSDLATFNSKIIANANIDLSENEIIDCKKIGLRNDTHTGYLQATNTSIELGGANHLIFTIDSNNNDANGIFKINCNSDSGPSLVEVNQSSQMGIGKTPSKELDVSGDGKFSGDLDVSGTISGNGSGLSSLSASKVSSGTLSMGRIADSSITNTKLENSSITLAGRNVSLGDSIDAGNMKTDLNLNTSNNVQFAKLGLGKAYDSDFSLDTNSAMRIRATPVDQSYNHGPEKGVLVLHSNAGIGSDTEGGNSNFSIEPSGNILTLSRAGGSGVAYPLGCIFNLSRWEHNDDNKSRSRLAFRLNHDGREGDNETDYNTAMAICSNNSVGIGTTNPSTNLDVDGSGNFSGNLDVSGIIKTNGLKGYTINNFSFEDFEGTDYDLTVNVDHVFEMGHQYNPGANFMCDSNSNGVSGSEVPEGFAFYSRGGNSEIDDNYPRLLMYITGVSGNTGIRGNLVLGREQRHDSGSYKLDVNGDGNFEEDLNVGGKIIGNIEKSGSNLNIKTTTSGAINITSVGAIDISSVGGVTIQSGTSNPISFKTGAGGGEHMKITNTGKTEFYGNVLIENNKNLDMSGTGNFTTGTGPVSLNGNVTIASGKDLTLSGSGSIFTTGTGAVRLNGDVTIANNRNLNMSGSGSNFTTGTGAVQLNGDVTIASGKDLGMSGGSTFTTGTGAVQLNGDVTIASGKDLTLSGSGSNFTTGTGAVQLNGDVTIASGKDLGMSGNGTFTTGTGAVQLNGDVTIANNRNLNMSGSGSIFTTGTGAVRLNGDVTIASGKDLNMSGTGTFTTGTGAVSLNGNVAIASGKDLTVNGDINFTGDLLKNGSQFSTSVWQTNGNNTIYYNTDNVGIGTTNPTTKLEVDGTVKATNYIATSDRNLKENIVQINNENIINKVTSLNGYNFNFKDDETKQTKSGLIAQEVEELMPELVSTNTDGNKSMDYNGMIPYLVECIKVQQTQIQTQQNQINMLKAKIENM